MKETTPLNCTERQFQNVYSDVIFDIKSNYGASKLEKPRGVILGGQPGAGKTTIHDILTEDNPDFVVINGDDYRELDPNFDKFNELYAEKSVDYTQAFSNRMVEQLISDLSDEKYNLIIEGTLRTIEVPLRTCEMLKEKGYTVELAVMAVNKDESWQGTIERAEKMEAKGITPRKTDKEKHDAVVDALPENLGILHEMDVFDRIALYSRADRNPIYDSSDSKYSKENPKVMLFAILHDEPVKTQCAETSVYGKIDIDSAVNEIMSEFPEYQYEFDSDFDENIVRETVSADTKPAVQKNHRANASIDADADYNRYLSNDGEMSKSALDAGVKDRTTEQGGSEYY